jgi:NhaA family Na+:H+ antiporter
MRTTAAPDVAGTGVLEIASLFIGTLAYDDHGYLTATRPGVLDGSLISAIVGYVLLRLGAKKIVDTR